MFGCEVPLVPFWKLQLSILHNIIYRCIERLVRVQLCQTAIVVLVYAVHWHQANMKEKVIWYDHDEKWSWKWSEKDGHTGARTQDHSVISTALYRLSYTTSSWYKSIVTVSMDHLLPLQCRSTDCDGLLPFIQRVWKTSSCCSRLDIYFLYLSRHHN